MDRIGEDGWVLAEAEFRMITTPSEYEVHLLRTLRIICLRYGPEEGPASQSKMHSYGCARCLIRGGEV